MLVPKRIVVESSCYALHPERSAKCPITNPHELISTTRGNFHNHGYPPVFYAVMSIFVQNSIPTAVISMRIFNSLVFVAMMTTLFILHRQRRQGIVLWSTFAVLVPFGLFIVPSVNPSSWAVISASSLWLALIGYYEARTRSTVIWFGTLSLLATVIGAGARSDSAIYCIIAVAAVAILKWRKSDRYWLRAVLPALIVVISAAFFLGSAQSSANLNGSTNVVIGLRGTLGLISAALPHLPYLWGSIFGLSGLGWLDTVMPEIVWMSCLGAAAALFFHGLRWNSWRKTSALSLIALALIAVPLEVIVANRIDVYEYIQPRYIYPLLILFAGVSLWGLAGRNIELHRAQILVICSVLTIAQAFALYTNTKRYVGGLNGRHLSLTSDSWWWQVSISPGTIVFSGAVLFLIAMACTAIWVWPTSNTRSNEYADGRD